MARAQLLLAMHKEILRYLGQEGRPEGYKTLDIAERFVISRAGAYMKLKELEASGKVRCRVNIEKGRATLRWFAK